MSHVCIGFVPFVNAHPHVVNSFCAMQIRIKLLVIFSSFTTVPYMIGNRTTSEPRSYQLFWSRASPHPSSKRFARNGAATADSFVGSDYLHDLFAPHILFMYLSTKISSTNCSNVRLPLLSCRNQFLEKKRRKKKKKATKFVEDERYQNEVEHEIVIEEKSMPYRRV